MKGFSFSFLFSVIETSLRTGDDAFKSFKLLDSLDSGFWILFDSTLLNRTR